MPVVKKVRGGDAKAVRGTSTSREDSGPLSLMLPSHPNKPPKSLEEYTIFLYGDKGVGKSTLCSYFPESITLMAEPLRKNLPILQIPDPNKNEPPLTWDRCRRYRDLIIKSKQFQTVVFDSTDRIYQMCQDYICRKQNCSHPNDKKDFGKTWGMLKSEFEEFISSFPQNGVSILPISHSRKREVKTITGEEFEQIVPTAPDACWTIWKAIADFAFYYGYHQRKRVIYLRGTDEIWAACGTSENHFLNPKGVPLAFIEVGNKPELAYKTLMDSFDNKVNGVTVDELIANYGLGGEEEDTEEEGEVTLPKKTKNWKKK